MKKTKLFKTTDRRTLPFTFKLSKSTKRRLIALAKHEKMNKTLILNLLVDEAYEKAVG